MRESPRSRDLLVKEIGVSAAVSLVVNVAAPVLIGLGPQQVPGWSVFVSFAAGFVLCFGLLQVPRAVKARRDLARQHHAAEHRAHQELTERLSKLEQQLAQVTPRRRPRERHR